MRAYLPDVASSPSMVNATPQRGGGGLTAQPSQTKRRRRPPSPREQARRKAWGHKWGQMIGQSWRKR